MQIVESNRKDVIDTIMLLREHAVGDGDDEMVNADYLASLCADDWRLWRTVTMNLQRVERSLPSYKVLIEEDRADISSKIQQLMQEEPKSLKWKMRAKIGERVEWYRDVEEASR